MQIGVKTGAAGYFEDAHTPAQAESLDYMTPVPPILPPEGILPAAVPVKLTVECVRSFRVRLHGHDAGPGLLDPEFEK